MGIMNFIKRLMYGYYIYDVCWVKLCDIKVPNEFRTTYIRKEKWNRKLNFYFKNGKFESAILIDKNFNLVDGYSSIKIAELKGIKIVPVYFV